LFCASVAPPTSKEVYAAIRAGQIQKLQGWIASGWQVNSADERGNTPLIHASAVGNAMTVRMLLGAGADPKMANNLGGTPLIYGATDAVKTRLLVEAGADVNAVSGIGRTPLIVAASVPGNTASVKLLLAHDADWKAIDKTGLNALVVAASAGNLEVVRMLVDRGSDAKYNPAPGGAALHFAAANRDTAMIRYLLAQGAQVDARLNFAMPVKFGKIALDQITPLMFAASYGPVDAVRALLEAGADVNAKDVRGMTPLMYAVSSETQDPVLVKLLLARGARRDERSQAGETALDWARKFNRKPVITLLGGTPLPAAAENAQPAGSGTSEAIARAVKLLETSQTGFFGKAGCVACHHGVTTAMATKVARSHGVATDPMVADEFRKIASTQAQGAAPMLIQMIDPPGATDTAMYMLLGMDAAGVEPNAATDAFAVYLFRHHRADLGWWTGGIARSPIAEGSLNRTALAIKVLNRYLPPAMQEEYTVMMAQSKARINRDAVVTTDDAVMKLLALRYTGATEVELRAAAKAVESRQRADGGWGGNPEMPSDAYATATAIFALAESGRAAERPQSYGRGAAWLLRNQQTDGSWHVKSRAPKFQPYFESGFPYGHDQWISNAATAWAVAGLSASMR
jgi:ankyrin repeat protein